VKVLQVTTQRPGWTGSGTTLEALASAAEGWTHAVLCGVPADEPLPAVAGVEPARVHAVRFGPGGDLPFPVVGMSDVMPYPSSVWSQLGAQQLDAWRAAWRPALERALEAERPDVLHVHHAWLGAALACEVAGEVPVVLHGHGTGLRQMQLTAHLREEVTAGASRAHGLCALHADHAARYREALGLPPERITVVGAGFDAARFRPRGGEPDADSVLFVGKWSEAKGVGPLLDAFAAVRARRPGAALRLAGGGAGPEAEGLRARALSQPGVEVLGRLSDADLVAAMQAAQVFVLPSLYEGLPLVLVEAAAAGCRLVATALPGVLDALSEPLSQRLQLVPLPALEGPDRVAPSARAAFVADLAAGLEAALAAGTAPPSEPSELAPFTWAAVTRRVEAAWSAALGRA
jgi:glycosyltransferase involved in cell wall biosynthesis